MPAISAGSPAPRRWSAGREPVPALVRIGARRLRRVQHEEAALLGQLVHARAGGEVVGVLRAAVQHDDERQRPGREAGRLEQLEGARPARGGERAGDEAGALRGAAPALVARRLRRPLGSGRGGAGSGGVAATSRTRPSRTTSRRPSAAAAGAGCGGRAAAVPATRHLGVGVQRTLDGGGGIGRAGPGRSGGSPRRSSSGMKLKASLCRCDQHVEGIPLDAATKPTSAGAATAGASSACSSPRAQRLRDAGDRAADVAHLLLHRRRRGRARRGWWRRARSSRCSGPAAPGRRRRSRPIQSSQSDRARREPSMPATSPCTTRP